MAASDSCQGVLAALYGCLQSIALDLVCLAVDHTGVCHGWGLPPANTLQAAALAWPLWCSLSPRQGYARCLVLIAVQVCPQEVVAAAGIDAVLGMTVACRSRTGLGLHVPGSRRLAVLGACFLQIHCKGRLLLGHPYLSSVTQAELSALARCPPWCRSDGFSISMLVACICAGHALRPVLVLLLPQASLVPASPKC